jgi:hypothetical protein
MHNIMMQLQCTAVCAAQQLKHYSTMPHLTTQHLPLQLCAEAFRQHKKLIKTRLGK